MIVEKYEFSLEGSVNLAANFLDHVGGNGLVCRSSCRDLPGRIRRSSTDRGALGLVRLHWILVGSLVLALFENTLAAVNLRRFRTMRN